VAVYRVGCGEGREEYRWWLAGTLNGLAAVLSHMERGEEAMAAAEEALSLARDEAADILATVSDGC
jgi:hypothetical protein